MTVDAREVGLLPPRDVRGRSHAHPAVRQLRRRLARSLFVGALGLGLLVQAAPVNSADVQRRTAPSSASVASAVRVVDLAASVDAMVAAMPRRGSEGYAVPSRAQAAALARSFTAMASGDLTGARAAAGSIGYRVEAVADRATGRRLLVLSESQDAAGRYPRAWGMFVVDPQPRQDLLVEVAHPLADLGTEQVGVAIFRRTGARALLVAGAHRAANADGSADVAHAPESAFQAVHRAATSAGTTVVQPHGFDEARHPRAGAAVVSSGTSPTRLARSVSEQLRRRSFEVCLYPYDCAELGGTTNVQGRAARAVGAEFLHLELSRGLRTAPDGVATTVAAVAGGLQG